MRGDKWVLWLLIFLFVATSHVSAQSCAYSLKNEMAVIEPQIAMMADGLKGNINTVRLVIPASEIEKSEYNVFITLSFPEIRSISVEAEVQSSHTSAFTTPFKISDEGDRHIFRTDLLANGNDGVLDFHFKDLRLSPGFDQVTLEVIFDVQGSQVIPSSSIDYASTSQLYYRLEPGVPVSPLAGIPDISAGPFTLEQIRPGKPNNVTLVLDDGFFWDTSIQQVDVKPIKGFTTEVLQTVPVSYANPDRTGTRARNAIIHLEKLQNIEEFRAVTFEVLGSYSETGLKIMLDSERARIGPVNASVKGAVPGKIQVGHYALPRVTTEERLPTEHQWSSKVSLAGFAITEARAGELKKGDILIITLPEGVSWDGVKEADYIRPVSTPQITGNSALNNLSFLGSNNRTQWSFADTSQRTIYTTIQRESGTPYIRDPAFIEFSGGFAVLPDDFDGPVEVVVSGSAVRDGFSYTASIIENVATEQGSLTGEEQKDQKNTYRLPVKSDFYFKDEMMIPYRVAPVIQDNRTLMGLRDLSEMMGIAEGDIVWNASTSTVNIQHEGNEVVVSSGSPNILVGETVIEMDTTPVIRDGRIMLPIGPLMRIFNISYNWEATTNTIVFTR